MSPAPWPRDREGEKLPPRLAIRSRAIRAVTDLRTYRTALLAVYGDRVLTGALDEAIRVLAMVGGEPADN